jgi:hypothetical protein
MPLLPEPYMELTPRRRKARPAGSDGRSPTLAQSCDFGLGRIVRRCGIFELFDLRWARSSPAHWVSSSL